MTRDRGAAVAGEVLPGAQDERHNLANSQRATVSVVTISYNQAEFLERAINSVLSQKGVDIDYIIVDPGSTDGSREIIERYRDRLSHIIFEKDKGPGDGLNRGLAKARGEYFYYLNSDDEVAENAFIEAVETFQADPDLDVVYGNGIIVDRDGRYVRTAYSSPSMSAELYARGLAVIIQQATFLRTAALRRVGGFNINNKTCWDGEAVFDIARTGGRFRRVWRQWGVFRIYDGTITGSGRLNNVYHEDRRRMAKTALGREPRSLDALVNRVLAIGLRMLDWRRYVDQALSVGRRRG